MNCQWCGAPMRDNVYRCRSNEWDGEKAPSCRKKECPQLNFCSPACLQKCWREVNWPKVVFTITPAIDAEAAVGEVVRIDEIARLERMWNA